MDLSERGGFGFRVVAIFALHVGQIPIGDFGGARVSLGNFQKKRFTARHRGGIHKTDAIDAMRPEQSSIRVHQPPLAGIFFHAEISAGGKLRAGLVTAVFIPGCRTRAGLQRGGFLGSLRGEIGGRMNFSGPIRVAELAIRVNERKIIRRHQRCRIADSNAAQAAQLQPEFGPGRFQSENDFGDARGIESAPMRHITVGQGIHPGKKSSQ